MPKTKTASTAAVAKYLEQEEVLSFVARLVSLVQSTSMDDAVLARHLHLLMEDVNESNGHRYDLRGVDWEALAERYIDMFDEADA